MNARQKSELEGTKGDEFFCKIALNGSYGYDIMNTEKYPKVITGNKTDAGHHYQKQTFEDYLVICNDTRLISLEGEQYQCNTYVREGFLKVDNAGIE